MYILEVKSVEINRRKYSERILHTGIMDCKAASELASSEAWYSISSPGFVE